MATLFDSNQYKYSSRGPLDAKALVKTYAELIDESTWLVDGTLIAYNGMITAVWLNKDDTSKNGVYFLFDADVTTAIKKPDVTNEANWHKLAEIADITERLTAIDERITALEDAESDVITYGYRNYFPSEGEPNKLYVAADEGKTYIWFDGQYMVVGGADYEEPEVIFGGSAD